MHPTGVTDEAERVLTHDLDAVAELDAVRELVSAVKKAQAALEPWTPEAMKRIATIAAQYLAPYDQTPYNTKNALLILGGLSGHTAEVHRD